MAGDQAMLVSHMSQYMLIAFWYLCTFAAAVTALDVPFPRVFKESVRLSAARGKTWDAKPSSLGWLKDISVPHVWFWHFYLLGVVCNGATLCITIVPLVTRAISPILYIKAAGSDSTGASLEALTYMSVVSLLVTCMLQTHLVRRLVETLFVMRYPATSRMHILAYIYGLAYYAVLSLTFVAPRTLQVAWFLITRTSSPDTFINSSSSIRSAQQQCGSPGHPCDFGAADSDYNFRGSELRQGGELVLDPEEAVAMFRSVFTCVFNALTTDGIIMLIHRARTCDRLIELEMRVLWPGAAVPYTPKSATPKHHAHPAQARVSSDHLHTLESMSPVSVYLDRPHAHSRSFDNLLNSPGISRAASRAASMAPRDFEYKLPRGGMFELVSCPHYFGEVLIYAGFLVMQAGSGLAPVVFLWVVRTLYFLLSAHCGTLQSWIKLLLRW